MKYTLEIDETERQKLAEAFAIMARKIGSCAPVMDAKSGTDHARAVLSPPSSPSTSPTGQSTPAVKPVAAPVEPIDRWGKDKKGNELPWPEGCEEAERTITKTEQKDKYLRVSWQAIGPNARGYVSANCFEKHLWPWLIKSTGAKVTLYLVKKGEYTNIVGVRA